MKQMIKKNIHFCYDIIIRIKNIFGIKNILKEKSYYPEAKRKSYLNRFFDNFIWIIKYVELNKFYNLYGFDIKSNINQNEYIAYREFMIQRNKANNWGIYSYIVLLRDKLLFSKYMQSNNIETIKIIAVIINGEFFSEQFEIIKNEKNLFKNTIFIKNIDGECANGIYCINSYSDYLSKKNIFKDGRFIIQEKLQQHKDMSKLYNNSVNTIRIVTMKNGEDIKILASGLRVGTSKSKNVDNWAAGGLYIELNNDGTLTKYGFLKPMYGGKIEIHPDTKIKFENYKVPMYDEVIKLVTKAHKTLYGIKSIGWDVAITDNGPILIEGNDNWEISLMQVNRGLKKAWKENV